MQKESEETRVFKLKERLEGDIESAIRSCMTFDMPETLIRNIKELTHGAFDLANWNRLLTNYTKFNNLGDNSYKESYLCI